LDDLLLYIPSLVTISSGIRIHCCIIATTCRSVVCYGTYVNQQSKIL